MSRRHEFEMAVKNESRLSDLEVAKGAAAVNEQMRWDFSPFWGRDVWVQYDARPEATDWLIRVVDETDVDNAAGYHTINDEGAVESIVALDNDFPWTAVLSHEALEIAANASVATLHVNRRNGFLYAGEVCDPVQARTYGIENREVSDFVLPAWFWADAPLDRRTAFKTTGLAPFEVADGGWAIRYDQEFNDATVNPLMRLHGERRFISFGG